MCSNGNNTNKIKNILYIAGQTIMIIVFVGGLLSKYTDSKLDVLAVELRNKDTAIETEISNKCDGFRKEIDAINKFHERHCIESKDVIEKIAIKVDEKLAKTEIDIYLRPIKQSIETIEKNIKAYQDQDARFKSEIIELLKK